MAWTKEKWDNEIGAVRRLYAKDPLVIYDKQHYANRKKMRDWEMKSGKILSEIFDIETMIDFGCGLGSYLEGALQGKTKRVLGIDIGYDLSKEFIPEYMHEFIVQGDVGKELDYGKWDCALSIEVAEHILPEMEDILISNLINASSRLIVFSAGNNFQYMHINAGRDKKYWVEKFVNLGCRELSDKGKALVNAWSERNNKYVRRRVIVMQV